MHEARIILGIPLMTHFQMVEICQPLWLRQRCRSRDTPKRRFPHAPANWRQGVENGIDSRKNQPTQSQTIVLYRIRRR